MQTFSELFTHFAGIFSLMPLYYFLPVLLFYYLFYVKNKRNWQHLKIQEKHPGSKQIRREINHSLTALCIFSLAGLFMYESAMHGYTNMYFEISEYGLPYFFLGLILNIFANDTIFYWVHRFMHLKWVFPHVHLVHHKSTSPTPFAVLAFHPIEAIMHATVYILLLFVIPIHPVMFGVFHLYNLLTNVAGHGGFEFMPEKLSRHWFFNWQNTVTNHDVHHKKFNCNYGNYFVLWDKLMNTTDKEKPAAAKNG